MNKRTLHRPLALLLALALTLTLTSVPALAADEGDGTTVPDNKATSVWVGGETLSASKTQNKAQTATFNPDTGTLTLKDYQGRGISARTGSLNIVVQGENRINETDGIGIYCEKDLTIVGQDAPAQQALTATPRPNASLTIHATNTALSTYNGKLTVKDLATLNCSSTTTCNPIIHVSFGQQGMTFSNIGTMLVRGNTTFGAISSSNPINFANIDTLEVLNDNSNAIVPFGGGLNITNCGTVLALSKGKNGIYTYGQDVTIQAQRLIAIGKEYGVWAYYGNKTINLQGVQSMLLYGETAAMYQSLSTIKLPTDAPEYKGEQRYTTADASTLKTATISITDYTSESDPLQIEYTGKPIAIEDKVVAKDGSADVTSQMTFIYAWYKDDGTTPLMEAPTDVGEYKVKVYGFSEHYYSDFNSPTTVEVKITPVNVPDSYKKSMTDTIGKGNNVYNLPAIPDRMHYGNPNSSQNQITPSIGGSKLSVKTGEGFVDGTYTVTIPVERDENANYNRYEITYTLTASNTHPRFDLCNGDPVQTDKDTPPNTTNAWTSDQDIANEFGYTFEGWYTAPNGWGTKATTYTAGTTYFAHWVATRAVAGYANVPGKDDPQLVYVKFNDGSGSTQDERRTVYTTGLDFTNDSMPVAKNGEYEWNKEKKILTLTGVMVNSGTSSTALTLPGGANVVLDEDTRMTSAKKYYIETEQGLVEATGAMIPEGAKAAAYNNFYGGGDKIPSMQVGQEEAPVEDTPDTAALTEEAPAEEYGLTISSKDDACAFSVRGGEVSVVGNLTLGKNATLSTQGISVLGDLTLDETAMLATVDTNKVQTRDLDLFVSGKLDGNGMLFVDGDITAEGQINLHDGATLMSWGALQSDEITLSQLAPNSFCNSLQSLEKITLDNTALELDGKVGFFAVEAEDLTITNGSELTILDYPLCGIAASGDMTVSNSTVKIENKSEEGIAALALIDSPSAENNKKATLSLQRARMTAPSGVSMTKFDEEMQIAMVDGSAAKTLTISPYHSSSSSSSNYAVNIAETKNGTVTPSATRVGSGSTVTLTVEPDGGYVLDSITAKDAAGKDVSLTKTADGKYTFKMPSSAVTVNASFRLRFTDVDPNAWYFDGVQDSVKKGLMEGMSETIFAPNGTLTRAQLVTILWRMEQQPGVNYALPFTDVTEGQWYTEAVRWAASTNVVNGTSATTFTPDAPVTREQLVTMLWRYAKQKGYDVSIGEETNILSYADATTVSEYAIPAMQWVCGAGIIQGADGKLLPKDSTTRAQIATIFQRFGALKA